MLIGVLIAAGVIILPILFIGGATALFLFTAKDVPVTDSQKRCFITAESVADFAEIDQDPVYESFEGKRYFDRSADYTYIYLNEIEGSYLDTTITIEQSLSDATVSYSMVWGGSKIGNKIGGVDVVKDNRFSWGDASGYVVQMYDGEEIGFTFITRKGKRIYYVNISGVYFESQEDINELLTRHLERFDKEKF